LRNRTLVLKAVAHYRIVVSHFSIIALDFFTGEFFCLSVCSLETTTRTDFQTTWTDFGEICHDSEMICHQNNKP